MLAQRCGRGHGVLRRGLGWKGLGLESVRRGIWWWLRGLGALCAPRGWDYSPATPAHPFGAAAFGGGPSRRFAPLGRTGGFE